MWKPCRRAICCFCGLDSLWNILIEFCRRKISKLSSSNRKKINNYRWRLGLAKGESKYDEIEKRLAAAPVLTVPTITLEGDANGAPHPDASTYAKKFSGRYAHRVINGGVGHNLPQEAPGEFAKAVIEVDG